MSTFLTLCQEMRADAGISGTGPTTTVGQTGIHLRIVNAIRDAWLRIQNHPKDWKWMWLDEYGLQTIADTKDYVLTDVGDIHIDTFIGYLTATGTSATYRITYKDWDSFKKKYGAVQTITANKPLIVTRLPNGNLRFYPTPDAIYTIDFEYQKTPQLLAENADVPDLPSEYHELIKYEALLSFGGLEDAPEVVTTAAHQREIMMNQLVWDQELSRKDQMEVRVE